MLSNVKEEVPLIDRYIGERIMHEWMSNVESIYEESVDDVLSIRVHVVIIVENIGIMPLLSLFPSSVLMSQVKLMVFLVSWCIWSLSWRMLGLCCCYCSFVFILYVSSEGF